MRDEAKKVKPTDLRDDPLVSQMVQHKENVTENPGVEKC